jgi:imidazolonepropionase-like amidohydrolase
MVLTLDSGSDAAAGAPGLVFGTNLHVEMYLLVTKAGLSPLEVLRGTTSLTANLFGWSDRGRIAPGLKADLLLVEGNPLNDIKDLLNIRGIWRDGVIFEGHSGFPLE